MDRLQTALRNASTNGIITLSAAIRIAKQFDEEEEETLNLITQCKSQVGMTLGGDLRTHEARLKGQVFNEKAFHFERLPEGQ